MGFGNAISQSLWVLAFHDQCIVIYYNACLILKSMTTVISIKSKDGIILASDSQGTSSKVKTTIKKVFKINSHAGIGASGDNSQIELFVDELKQHFRMKLNWNRDLEIKCIVL